MTCAASIHVCANLQYMLQAWFALYTMLHVGQWWGRDSLHESVQHPIRTSLDQRTVFARYAACHADLIGSEDQNEAQENGESCANYKSHNFGHCKT